MKPFAANPTRAKEKKSIRDKTDAADGVDDVFALMWSLSALIIEGTKIN